MTRETAFIPLLGSSNGLFLAITAVFYVFAWGRFPKRPRTIYFPHYFFPEITRKANGARQLLPELCCSENFPILGAPMPLLTRKPGQTHQKRPILPCETRFFRFGVPRELKLNPEQAARQPTTSNLRKNGAFVLSGHPNGQPRCHGSLKSRPQ